MPAVFLLQSWKVSVSIFWLWKICIKRNSDAIHCCCLVVCFAAFFSLFWVKKKRNSFDFSFFIPFQKLIPSNCMIWRPLKRIHMSQRIEKDTIFRFGCFCLLLLQVNLFRSDFSFFSVWNNVFLLRRHFFFFFFFHKQFKAGTNHGQFLYMICLFLILLLFFRSPVFIRFRFIVLCDETKITFHHNMQNFTTFRVQEESILIGNGFSELNILQRYSIYNTIHSLRVQCTLYTISTIFPLHVHQNCLCLHSKHCFCLIHLEIYRSNSQWATERIFHIEYPHRFVHCFIFHRFWKHILQKIVKHTPTSHW